MLEEAGPRAYGTHLKQLHDALGPQEDRRGTEVPPGHVDHELRQLALRHRVQGT